MKTGIFTFARFCTAGFFLDSSSDESCPNRFAALILPLLAAAAGLGFSSGLGVRSLKAKLVVSFLRKLAAYCAYCVVDYYCLGEGGFALICFETFAGAGLFTGGVIESAGTSWLCCFGSPSGPSGSSITVLVYYLASMGWLSIEGFEAGGARFTEARGGGY